MVHIKALAVLFALLFTSLVSATAQCPDNKPPDKDVTCFTAEGKGGLAVLYYGRSAFWHAWHVAASGLGGKVFDVASDKHEADENRKYTLKGIPIPKEWGLEGVVRDEKPMRMMHWENVPGVKATVYLLPASEGSQEGGIGSAALRAIGDLGGGGKIKMIDNRADKRTPPTSRPNSPIPAKPVSRQRNPRKRSSVDTPYFPRDYEQSLDHADLTLQAREPVYADEQSVAGVRMILRRALDELELFETEMAKRDAFVDEEYAFAEAQMAKRDAYAYDDYSFGADLYARDYFDYESVF